MMEKKRKFFLSLRIENMIAFLCINRKKEEEEEYILIYPIDLFRQLELNFFDWINKISTNYYSSFNID
jgi:hypothetical protein